MIEHPERQIAEFVKAGADRLTVHVEACPDVPAVLKAIRDAGAHPGLSLNPPTRSSASALRPPDRPAPGHEREPGWGGQPFVEGSMERLEAVRAIRTETKTNFLIEVDGGIYPTTPPTPPPPAPTSWWPAPPCSTPRLRRSDRSPPPRQPHPRPTTRVERDDDRDAANKRGVPALSRRLSRPRHPARAFHERRNHAQPGAKNPLARNPKGFGRRVGGRAARP
jgi:hypothetical protein